MPPGILAATGVTPLLPEWAAVALVLLTLTILLVAMRRISHSLKDWSLGSALSEEVTYKTSDGTTTREETKLEPSVSRYVALYGLVGIPQSQESCRFDR
jgi:Na+-transporting methylmalonyl-CoA/oxaloacetate decarboxylase gamma subunit